MRLAALAASILFTAGCAVEEEWAEEEAPPAQEAAEPEPQEPFPPLEGEPEEAASEQPEEFIEGSPEEPLRQPEEAVEEVFEPTGASAATTYAELDPYDGDDITLTGTFTQERKASRGILTLASGLRVAIPHVDQFLHGIDWFRYVGRVCTISGVIHTYVLDVDGYRREPTLRLTDFIGPGE